MAAESPIQASRRSQPEDATLKNELRVRVAQDLSDEALTSEHRSRLVESATAALDEHWSDIAPVASDIARLERLIAEADVRPIHFWSKVLVNLKSMLRRIPWWQSVIIVYGVVATVLTAFFFRYTAYVSVPMEATLVALNVGATVVILSTRLSLALDRSKKSDALSVELSRRSSQLKDLLASAVYGPARAQATPRTTMDPTEDEIAFLPAEAPSPKAAPGEIIGTEAETRLAAALSRRNGAAVGLAGPRGVGKTALAQRFTTHRSDGQAIGILVAAPVAYDVPLFLHAVLKELCIAVLGREEPHRTRSSARAKVALWWLAVTAPALAGMIVGAALIVGQITGYDLRHHRVVFGALVIAAGFFLSLCTALVLPERVGVWDNEATGRARELRQRIEYTQKYTMGGEVSATVQGVGMKRTTAQELSRLPITEVDIPRELATLVQSAGRLVIIAIDELDKMRQDDDAIGFLNRLKVLFPTPGCSFIVSVSESAWARFEQRGLPFRDAFDSSLDDVIRVDLLRPVESRDVLRGRNSQITDLQALVCHCLSGGLPRDLLRAARDLAHEASRSTTRDLPTVLASFLRMEVATKTRAAEFRIRSYASCPLIEPALNYVAMWRDRWDSMPECDAMLRRVPPRQAEAERLTINGAEALQREQDVAILHTVRETFAPSGPLTRLLVHKTFDDPIVSQGIAGVAVARDLLSRDPADTWTTLNTARSVLGLVDLGRWTEPSASTTAGT